MKIAILSDFHANVVALRKVLLDCNRLGVEKIFALGDYVGYYFEPEAIFQELSHWDCEYIYGNHEQILLTFKNASETQRQEWRSKYGSGFDICLEQLSKESWEKITSMPSTKKIEVDGSTIQMCHGSPWDFDEYIYPDAPRDILNKCDQEGIDFVLMGHTHYPFVFHGNNTLIANVGSVGQSRVLGGVANWAVIDLTNRTYTPKQTLFDPKSIQQEAQRKHPELPYLWEIFNRNRQ